MSAVSTSSLIQPLRPALLFSVLAHLLFFLWVMDSELPRPVWSQPLAAENSISIQLQAYPGPAAEVKPVPPAPPPEVSKVVEPLPLPVIQEPVPEVVPPPKALPPHPKKPSNSVKTVNSEARASVPPAPKPVKPAKVVPVAMVKEPNVNKPVVKKAIKKPVAKKVAAKKKTIAKKPVAKISTPVSQKPKQQPVKKAAKSSPKKPLVKNTPVKKKADPKPVPVANVNTTEKVADKQISNNLAGLEVVKKSTNTPISTVPITLSKPDYLQPPAPPRYPARSKRRGEQGTVWLRILLDSAGTVQQLLVKSSSGFDRLDKSALEAARAWKFKPALVDGRNHDAWLEIPVHFKLR